MKKCFLRCKVRKLWDWLSKDGIVADFNTEEVYCKWFAKGNVCHRHP